MTRRIFVTMLVLGASLTLAESAMANPRPIQYRQALRDLQDAYAEMQGAAPDFGCYRANAILATQSALMQVDCAFQVIGDPHPGLRPKPKKPNRCPDIRDALHELREARVHLLKAPDDCRGHRVQALRDIDFAICQLELASKHCR